MIKESRPHLHKMRVQKHYAENKALFTHENKANENKVFYCKASSYETMKKNNEKLFSFVSNLQTYCNFKLDSQKMDQHTGGKWVIHGTNRRKDNQMQSLELPCRIS